MSDELKTQAKDARPDYDPPRAVRMDGGIAGRGNDHCISTGSGAGGDCLTSGQTADRGCGDSGNTAAMVCLTGSGGPPP